MADSSPLNRRSLLWSSPQRSVMSDILSEDRNSEARHKLLIEAAKREHDRVREEAERVYREYLQAEERKRLLEEKWKEEERIRREEQLAAERAKLHALRAKKVEIPPAPPPEPPRPEPAPTKAAPAPAPAQAPPAPAAASAPNFGAKVASSSSGVAQTTSLFGAPTLAKPSTSAQLGTASPFSTAPKQVTPTQTTATAQPTPVAKPLGFGGGFGGLLNGNGNQPQTNGIAPAQPAPAVVRVQPLDRYTVIHRNLKDLRRSMAEQAKRNPSLKSRMGDMRREIKKSIGQLTGGAPGVNRQQQHKIIIILKEALSNQMGSQPVDSSAFVVTPREPVQGATHNDPALPSLFFYLLNILAKAAISQYINEGGPRPETADPVGVVVAATFSEPDFLWRGQSLIDVIIAKFRVVCPVLFGYRGNEKMEGGRQSLGWKKEGGHWIHEQAHMDRMTGLGAGFASISLRNFGKSKKTNPYPPRHYWTALARIVNTPGGEISNTQCVVLKSMIANYEAKFFDAYGTAAVAALRTALIEFPARATEKTAAVTSLRVQAQLIQKEYGLALA